MPCKGDADGLGHTRKQEIRASAIHLGLRSEDDVLVYEHPDFPDNMQTAWNADRIAEVLSSLFSSEPSHRSRKDARGVNDKVPKPGQASIDAIITFDQIGVSNHPNHYSLYHGAVAWIWMLKAKRPRESSVVLYALTSTGLVRKYMALLDAPLTMLLCVWNRLLQGDRRQDQGAASRLVFMSNMLEWRQAQRAMTNAHVSQMRWFRWGWIVLSRYMVVNDLRRIKVQ